MGWLFMKTLGGHSGPRQYLDAQLTFERDGVAQKVLRSALARMQVYYAAVERLGANNAREVSAVVCLVRYNPRDREGLVFGYKDMSEDMGPYERTCPEAILNLLTPTDNVYALEWRSACRANIAARRAQSAKPSPRPGQIIQFDAPPYVQGWRSPGSLHCGPAPAQPSPRSLSRAAWRALSDPQREGAWLHADRPQSGVGPLVAIPCRRSTRLSHWPREVRGLACVRRYGRERTDGIS